MTATADQQTVAACIRCDRSPNEHLLRDQNQADEIQQRIWKALGWPCAEFTLTPAVVFAGNQAATSRWARRPQPSSPAAAGGDPATARQGAALARQALTRRNDTRRAL